MAPGLSAAAAPGARPKRKRARKSRTAVVENISSDSSSSSSSSSSAASEKEGSASSDACSSDDEVTTRRASAAQISGETKTSKAERMRRAQQMDIDSDSESRSSSSESSSSSSASSDTSSNGAVKRRTSTKAKVRNEIETEQEEEERERRERVQRLRDQYTPPPEPLASFEELEKLETRDRKLQESPLEAMYSRFKPQPPPLVPNSYTAFVEKRRQIRARREEALARRRNKMQGSTQTSLTADTHAAREADFSSMWMRLMVDEFGEELDALRKKDQLLAGDAGGTSRMPLLIDALQAGSDLYSRGHEGTALAAEISEKAGKGVPIASLLPASAHEIDEVALLLRRSREDGSADS